MGKNFKYTNKQYFLNGAAGFFIIMFIIAMLSILANFGSFWESHKLEVLFLIVISAGFLFSFLSTKKSKEIKSKAYLSDKALIIDGVLRFPLDTLTLDTYKSQSLECFHLYNDKKSFTLYTNINDELILSLGSADIKKNEFQISDYRFKRPSFVEIKTSEGGLSFDLNTGSFQRLGIDEKTQTPTSFVQTPKYRLKR